MQVFVWIGNEAHEEEKMEAAALGETDRNLDKQDVTQDRSCSWTFRAVEFHSAKH